MLKRLRTKIVLINMLSVGAVMLAVFLLLCVGSYQSARNEVDRALHSALEADGRMGVDPAVIGRPGGRDPQPPDGPDRNRQTSVATVTVRIEIDGNDSACALSKGECKRSRARTDLKDQSVFRHAALIDDRPYHVLIDKKVLAEALGKAKAVPGQKGADLVVVGKIHSRSTL